MNFGVLSDYFDGAGAKTLSEVEVNPNSSRQHEFQGVIRFREFLGTPSEKEIYDAYFYWLEDGEESEPLSLASFCTWSDVRRDKPGRSPEYHLYYGADSEPVVHRAKAGDQLVIARKKDGTLLVILCPADSTTGQQLLWLFGLDLIAGQAAARQIGDDSVTLSFAARAVLQDIGIVFDEPEPDALSRLIDQFGYVFPTTAAMSTFARDTLTDVDVTSDPDGTLVAWMEHEEILFRHMEREIVAKRLKDGFFQGGTADVDGFLKFSLSVQNRRKSRAGWAFGHHVEAILKAHDLRYTREATTEKRNAADFLFPGEEQYLDPRYPEDRLTMLAVKTSCKDRWRQVLAEADRISTKHLLTLEPAISKVQTDEMKGQQLQLVLPAQLHETYRSEQRTWLMNIVEFIETVRTYQDA